MQCNFLWKIVGKTDSNGQFCFLLLRSKKCSFGGNIHGEFWAISNPGLSQDVFFLDVLTCGSFKFKGNNLKHDHFMGRETWKAVRERGSRGDSR